MDSLIENAVCNDPNGLCLVGNTKNIHESDGICTSLVRLASRLQQQDHHHHQDNNPLIAIETKNVAVWVKEHDGHAAALRVPAVSAFP